MNIYGRSYKKALNIILKIKKLYYVCKSLLRAVSLQKTYWGTNYTYTPVYKSSLIKMSLAVSHTKAGRLFWKVKKIRKFSFWIA